MGFFSKVFKKVKKGFKSIGKGIKSAFKKIGKFMGKIGIIGQLALMFTPVGAMMGNFFASIGQAAGGVFSKIVGKAAVQGAAGSGLLGSSSAILRGAGTVLKAAGNFAKAGHSAFRTVTDGISSFVGEFSKTALKKIPGMERLMPSLGDASDSFFAGPNSAWSKVQGEVMKNANAVVSNFNEAIGVKPAPATTTPVKATADVASKTGYGDDGLGLDSDYAKQIQARINAGQSNLTASTSNVVPDPQALKSSLLDPKGTQALEFNQKAFDDAISKGFKGMQEIDASGFNQTALKEGVSKATDMLIDEASEKSFITKFGERTMEAVRSIPEKVLEAPEKFVENIDQSIQKSLDTKAMQAIGLQDKPVYQTTAYQSYVPEFTPAPAGSYSSPEINDRAMQVQLGGTNFYNQVPFGAGANFYVQTMSRGIGGTA